MEPATTIINICGGFKAVAEITQRDETRVRRWTYPKNKGGTGGLIPTECQQLIMATARAEGIPLTPDHFFPVDAGQKHTPSSAPASSSTREVS